VEYVVRAIDGPLLVLSVTRPELLERRPAWGEGATMLEPIGGDDARLLVDALPERDALDEKLAATILETAEGVPLFLEQLAAHAVEAGLVDDRVPMTLDALLASRIDGLAPGERAVLSRAAVVGRAFSRESLGALTPDDETRELGGRLASLERRRLVRPRDDEHEFVHPLVRGAAYDAIGRPERAAMHETLARWLDDRGEGDELVGTHLERAALDTALGLAHESLAREASSMLTRAGRRALFAIDNAAAANLLGRAAELLASDDLARLELECSLGHALKGLGAYKQATSLLESVAERARSVLDQRLEFRARVELVTPALSTGSTTPDGAIVMLDEAVGVFDDCADTLGIARAEMTYAIVLEWSKRVDAAAVHIWKAEQAYRRIGIVGQTDTIAVTNALAGGTGVADAVRLCEECIARHADEPRRNAYLRLYLAFLLALGGDLPGARGAGAEARRGLEELGEEVGLHTTAALFLGSIEALAGDWHAVRAIFEAVRDYTCERSFHRAWLAYSLARLGEAALGLADPHAATSLADEARDAAVEADVETDIWWRRVAARALSATGHPRKAVRLGREAVVLADGMDDLVVRGGTLLDLAEVQLRVGSAERAAALARDGLALLDRKGAVLPAEQGRARFADLLARDGGRGDDRAHRGPTQQVGGH